MDERRWNNANTLVSMIANAERLAGVVAGDYIAQGLMKTGVSHPSEDEANDIKRRLAELRKVAAGIAEREAVS